MVARKRSGASRLVQLESLLRRASEALAKARALVEEVEGAGGVKGAAFPRSTRHSRDLAKRLSSLEAQLERVREALRAG